MKYVLHIPRQRADRLHARLKAHYHSGAGLPSLIVRAALDYACLLEEHDIQPIDSPQNRPGGLLRRFLGRDA